MKARELREQGIEELRQVAEETSKQIVEMKWKKGLQKSSVDGLKLRNLRRDLARVKTIMREMELKKDV